MKKHSRGVYYTVRGVPREVDRALRRKAAQRKQSLNQLIGDERTEATIGSPRRADFSDLVLAAQRQIDGDMWK